MLPLLLWLAITCSPTEISDALAYSTTPGYCYLSSRCDLVHQSRVDNADIVVWLAEHGYDSPAADCTVSIQIDRTISEGDHIAYQLIGGKLASVVRVSSWNLFPGWTLGTLVRRSASDWVVSSYGVETHIQLRNGHEPFDNEYADFVAVDFHGTLYQYNIPDKRATKITAEFTIPCYNDHLTLTNFVYGSFATRTVSN